MKRVTHQAKCDCLSNLAKIFQPLPPDIVCNCCCGPMEKITEPEYEIKTTCLTSSSVKCNCENEAEFVSACDVCEPLVPKGTSVKPPPRSKTTDFSACKCSFERPKIPDVPDCICDFECPLRQNIPEKESEFAGCKCNYESPNNTRIPTSTCICDYGCPMKQGIPTNESEKISSVSVCRCRSESPFTDTDQRIPTKESEKASDFSACKCSFETLFSTKPTKELEKAIDFSACKCNFESLLPTKPTDTSTCICNSECPLKNLNFENMSLISSTSQDLLNVERIKALIQKEKCLKREIQELEHKEKAYANKLKELNGIDSNRNVDKSKQTYSVQNLHLQNQQLEGDNKNLEDQIKDVKLELKQVIENVEGPLKRELERERRKCEQLENQIRDLVSKQSNVENKGREEIEFLSRQLDNAKRNIIDLHLVNKRLREEVCVLCCKCNEMQNELINQKLREVNLLNKLSAKKRNQLSSCICNGDTGSSIPNEELEAISKNLSQLLREAKQCSTCKIANPEVIDTVKCIKDLVNVVVNPKKKDSDKNKHCARTGGK